MTAFAELQKMLPECLQNRFCGPHNLTFPQQPPTPTPKVSTLFCTKISLLKKTPTVWLQIQFTSTNIHQPSIKETVNQNTSIILGLEVYFYLAVTVLVVRVSLWKDFPGSSVVFRFLMFKYMPNPPPLPPPGKPVSMPPELLISYEPSSSSQKHILLVANKVNSH